jgi:hypothetical protein
VAKFEGLNLAGAGVHGIADRIATPDGAFA